MCDWSQKYEDEHSPPVLWQVVHLSIRNGTSFMCPLSCVSPRRSMCALEKEQCCLHGVSESVGPQLGLRIHDTLLSSLDSAWYYQYCNSSSCTCICCLLFFLFSPGVVLWWGQRTWHRVCKIKSEGFSWILSVFCAELELFYFILLLQLMPHLAGKAWALYILLSKFSKYYAQA